MEEAGFNERDQYFWCFTPWNWPNCSFLRRSRVSLLLKTNEGVEINSLQPYISTAVTSFAINDSFCLALAAPLANSPPGRAAGTELRRQPAPGPGRRRGAALSPQGNGRERGRPQPGGCGRRGAERPARLPSPPLGSAACLVTGAGELSAPQRVATGPAVVNGDLKTTGSGCLNRRGGGKRSPPGESTGEKCRCGVAACQRGLPAAPGPGQ